MLCLRFCCCTYTPSSLWKVWGSSWQLCVQGLWSDAKSLSEAGYWFAQQNPQGKAQRKEVWIDSSFCKWFDFQYLFLSLVMELGKAEGCDVTREQIYVGVFKICCISSVKKKKVLSHYLTGHQDFINDCCRLVKPLTRRLVLQQ